MARAKKLIEIFTRLWPTCHYWKYTEGHKPTHYCWFFSFLSCKKKRFYHRPSFLNWGLKGKVEIQFVIFHRTEVLLLFRWFQLLRWKHVRKWNREKEEFETYIQVAHSIRSGDADEAVALAEAKVDGLPRCRYRLRNYFRRCSWNWDGGWWLSNVPQSHDTIAAVRGQHFIRYPNKSINNIMMAGKIVKYLVRNEVPDNDAMIFTLSQECA